MQDKTKTKSEKQTKQNNCANAKWAIAL